MLYGGLVKIRLMFLVGSFLSLVRVLLWIMVLVLLLNWVGLYFVFMVIFFVIFIKKVFFYVE